MSFRSAGLAAALLCLGATGCERAVPVAATTEYEASVRTVGIPPSDRTRLYILTGKTTTGSLLGPAYRLHLISGDIYVDGVKIGSVNPKEVMVLDVIPGKHVIYWTYLNQTGGPRNDRLELDLQGGTIGRACQPVHQPGIGGIVFLQLLEERAEFSEPVRCEGSRGREPVAQ